ncbi:MAG: gamma-glutamyltransferase [Dongiaceae bacterium]
MRAGAALALLLAGCGPNSGPAALFGGESGPKTGDIIGAVTADEPRAAIVAREVLTNGGTTADAAVALYFTLAVTLPSEAGIGGGGICLVHDGPSRRTEVLDFLPRAAARGGVAVPAAVRGMAALHARYGRQRWEELLGPAEQLARFGMPTSRALAREMATAGDRLATDLAVRAVFVNQNGKLRDEGEPLQQVELGGALGEIRQQGAGALYGGPLGQRLAQAAQSIGAPLTIDDLRNTLPQFYPPLRLAYGDQTLVLVPTPGGIVFGEMMAALTAGVNYRGTAAAERPHLFVEAAKRAFADRAGWMQPDGTVTRPPAELVSDQHGAQLMVGYEPNRATPAASLVPPPVERPENPWAASFLVADGKGSAIVCNVTMNDLFGTGRMAPGTGILLAPAPDPRGTGFISLTPTMLVGQASGATYFVGAASGGPTAPTALAATLLRVAADGETLEAALAGKRLHHGGMPDVALYEDGIDPAVPQSLTERGQAVAAAGIIGRVAGLWCPGSITSGPQTCQPKVDPRTDGLSQIIYK